MLGAADEELAQRLRGTQQPQEGRGAPGVVQDAVHGRRPLRQANVEQQGPIGVGGVPEAGHEGSEILPGQLRRVQEPLGPFEVHDARVAEGTAQAPGGGGGRGQCAHRVRAP